MSIKYHYDIEQGTEQWTKIRQGILTSSEMKKVLTPTLKIASNDTSRSHEWELLAQRISGYTEPTYINDDMLRGQTDEIEARILYSKNYAQVTECGFITNDKLGFIRGFSPDGLVGDDGLIECKSRRQKYQIETIMTDEVPLEYMMQIQDELFLSERKWCDFISFSGGLPMFVKRVFSDAKFQEAIQLASIQFENKLKLLQGEYMQKSLLMIPTERKIFEEIT